MSSSFASGFENETFRSNLNKGRMGFSGCDINAIIRLPAYKLGDKTFNQEKIFQIGTLQTIAISTYNSKTPIKALGFKSPIAIARGGRTIAGTLIFNQLHTHVFDDNTFPSLTRIEDDGLLTYSTGKTDLYISPYTRNSNWERSDNGASDEANAMPKDKEKMKKQWDFSWDNTLYGERSKPSDIPPFDIVILMVNELGNVGKIVLYGVDIVHDSQTLSVEDIYTEVQYQFMAREIEYFHAANFEEAKTWTSTVVPETVNIQKKENEASAEAKASTGQVAPSPSTTASSEKFVNPSAIVREAIAKAETSSTFLGEILADNSRAESSSTFLNEILADNASYASGKSLAASLAETARKIADAKSADTVEQAKERIRRANSAAESSSAFLGEILADNRRNRSR